MRSASALGRPPAWLRADGAPAIQPLTTMRCTAYLASASSADGALVLEISEGSCDEIRFLDCLYKLLEQLHERMVFLTVDNAPFHKSPAVEYWPLDYSDRAVPPSTVRPGAQSRRAAQPDVRTHVARRHPSNLAKHVTLNVEYHATRTSEIVSKYLDGEYVAYTK